MPTSNNKADDVANQLHLLSKKNAGRTRRSGSRAGAKPHPRRGTAGGPPTPKARRQRHQLGRDATDAASRAI